ncbi:hypothetical protein AAKU67_004536, partial [Oxalobacteraceae bacterium GrIS 2.11]
MGRITSPDTIAVGYGMVGWAMKPDQRSSRRKPLRAHGTVTFDGAAPLAIHTIDIGSGGLSIGMSLQ